jgi:hypothetical protein
MSGVEWHARRVGNRIVCGRKVAGRYVCQGELADVERLIAGPDARVAAEVITLPAGYVMDPPGSGHWRLTARARDQAERNRQPRGIRRQTAGELGSAPGIPRVLRGLPGPDWTRECPHCGCTARVTSAVLDSPQR